MGTHHDQLPLNNSRPLIMHIDLNSCFAIIEQQANPLYRRKPVAVAAYDTPRGMVIASSYEAKAKGIKLGVNVGQARLIDPEVIVLMPDPAKYRYAHSLFRQVLEEYSSELHAKSIDEFVLDFSGSPTIRDGRDLMDVGYEIKHKIKDKVGSYVTVNVGIGTNRFWAKTAAGLNKPDGLDMMSAENALKIYGQMELTDLTGINHRYQARLNQNCIFKPLQFYEATEQYLHKQVFKSIVGRQWYARLRGWEVDDVIWGRKSIGHNYAIGQKTADREEIGRLLMKLCHKVGRRMRHQGFYAQGIHLSIAFQDGQWWGKSYDTKTMMYATSDIYHHTRKLLDQVNIPCAATNLSVSVYHLVASRPEQMDLFGGGRMDKRALTDAADGINDRYGNYTLVPAVMAGMDKVIIDRIAFGSVKDYLD
jgi:DNA polymerase-4